MYKLIGKRIGRLEIVAFNSLKERPGAKGKRAKYWTCLCDCGNIYIGHTNGLNSGRIMSCGCKRKEKRKIIKVKIRKQRVAHNYKGHKDVSGSYLTNIKNKAKERNIHFDGSIDCEYLWNLINKQNLKCAISNIGITLSRGRNSQTASLDRINSDLGYTKDNIQWVHKDINWLKNRFPQNKFIELCQSVSKNNVDVGCYT